MVKPIEEPGSVFWAIMACRCPRCGRGRLYDGWLKVVDRCAVCGLDLSRHDTGDAPAVFVILILGFVVVAMALLTEGVFSPPMWVHVVLWPPIILGLALGMLRVIKSLFMTLNYRHRTEDFHGPRQ